MAGVFMLLTVPIVNWRTSDHVSNVLAFRVFTRHQYVAFSFMLPTNPELYLVSVVSIEATKSVNWLLRDNCQI